MSQGGSDELRDGRGGDRQSVSHASAVVRPIGREWREWLELTTVADNRDDLDPRPVDLLLWIGGDLHQVEDDLGATFRSLMELRDAVHVTLLLDGPLVRTWAPVDYYTPLLPSRSEIVLPEALDLPAVLYNLGLFRSRSPWLAFAWPGVCPTPRGLEALLAEAKNHPLVYGSLPSCDVAQPQVRLDSWRVLQREGHAFPPELQHPPMPHGWLQMVDGVPMANCLLSTGVRKHIGGFDHRALLQGQFWWDYVRRLSRDSQLHGIAAAAPPVRWAWSDYPFGRRIAADPDLVCRLVSDEGRRVWSTQGQSELPPADLGSLASDLPEAAAERLRRRVSRWAYKRSPHNPDTQLSHQPTILPPGRWPLKVAVLGGVYEPPHTQICFYSFFNRLVGQGCVTWRPILDRYVLPADILQNDLVIFARPRSDEAKSALDCCLRYRVATLAMFDDNWLTVAKDWPEYLALFSRGKPDYENFLYVCREADLTVTYNEWMAKDLAPYCRRLTQVAPPVDMAAFQNGEFGPRRDDHLTIGYAGGGAREHQGAFVALRRFVAEHAHARVFIMGHSLPPELAALPSEKVLFLPYEFSFPRYARTMARVRPDMMLAPLGSTHTDRCKCPRKFFDAASVGGVGIYSDVETYRPFVQNGETGFLVKDGEENWYQVISKLAVDSELRRRVAGRAREEVRARYSIEALLPEFLNLLQQAVTLSQERRK